MDIDKQIRILSAEAEHDLEQEAKGYRDYVLQQDINFFGRLIPAGTIYKQVNADHYHPMLYGSQCPSLGVDFYIAKNNPAYFLPKKRFNE